MRGGVSVVVVVLVVFASVMPVVAAEPQLLTILDSLGFTNRIPVTLETFPKGKYDVTLYAEWAGWRDTNQLYWYEKGTDAFNLIFDGPDGVPPGSPMGNVTPPTTKSFTSGSTFGLCLNTLDGRDYSERTRNNDGKQHAMIYQSGTDLNLYFIGFENMNYPSSDFDYNDMVLSLKRVQAYLTVNSPYDSPNPTSGWFDIGTSTMASVTSPVSGGSGTRYVCTGWTGTGDVPASGSLTAVSFILTQDSSVAWNWKTQYLLTVVTDPIGLVPLPLRNPAGETGPPNGWWYDNGVDVAPTAQPVTGYAFAYWDVDGSSQGNGIDTIAVEMNTFHTAIAHYVPLYDLVIETTTGGTTVPSPGTYSYCCGSTADVKATVQSGYVFHNWELDTVNAGSSSPYLVLMNAHHTLKAVFTPTPVGGEWIPIDKSVFLTPLLEWVSLMIVMTASFVVVKRRKKQLH